MNNPIHPAGKEIKLVSVIEQKQLNIKINPDSSCNLISPIDSTFTLFPFLRNKLISSFLGFLSFLIPYKGFVVWIKAPKLIHQEFKGTSTK